MRRASFYASALLPSLLLAGCSLAGDITPPPFALTQAIPPSPTVSAPQEVEAPASPERAPDPVAGAVIYAEKCAPCHGAQGLGDGPQAPDLPDPPTALADPAVARLAIPADWYAVVSLGRIDRFMPGFQSLTSLERWDVVAYALNLGLGSAEVEAGRSIYADFCAECHGPDGRGMGGVEDLASSDSFSQSSLTEISETIAVGTGEAMPGFAGELTLDDLWAVSAYVRNLALYSGAEPPVAGSPAAGSIVGRVVNGTEGGEVPLGLEVTLHGFDGQAEGVTRSSRVDAQGGYAFEAVENAPGRLFVVTVTYQGVLYGTEIAHLTPEGAPAEAPLTIYETTADPSAARLERLHLLLQFPSPGVVEIVELWLVSNPGDRTLATTTGEGLLRVTLPPGAGQISFDEGERFRAVEGGFVDTFPLRPGQASGQLTFSYQLPYPRRLELDRTFPLDVAAAVILVPQGGPAVSGPGVTDAGVRQVGEILLHQYEVDPLPTGQPMAIMLAGRAPAAPGAGGLSVTGETALGAIVLLASLAGAGWWLFRPGGRRGPAARGLSGAPDRVVLAAIARLDEEHEAGRIGDEDYGRRRAELKRRAVELLRRGGD